MRFLYIATGVIFLLLGLVGLALPVIPQVPFLLIAVVLLTRGSKRVRRRIAQSNIYQKHLKGRNVRWLKEMDEEEKRSGGR